MGAEHNNQLMPVPTQLPSIGNRPLAVKYLDDIPGVFLKQEVVKPSSRKTYERALRHFMEWTVGRAKLLGDRAWFPGREDIVAYRDHLEEIEKLSAPTVSLYLVVVHKFFQWLEGEKRYPNVAAGVKATGGREGCHSRRGLSPDEEIRLAQKVREALDKGNGHIKHNRDYALVVLRITTGLRGISIVNANVGDIVDRGTDPEGGAILLYQGKGRIDKKGTKPLTKQVLKAIDIYLEARGNPGPGEPLFISHGNKVSGKRLTTRSEYAVVDKYLRLTKLKRPGITPHSLRHGYAQAAIERGASLRAVQLGMGHKSITTTQVYLRDLEREQTRKGIPERIMTDLLFGHNPTSTNRELQKSDKQCADSFERAEEDN